MSEEFEPNNMSEEFEVVIPTFINAHVFWIIPKKNILFRLGMHTFMSQRAMTKIDRSDEINDGQMVAVNIEGTWARGIVNNALQNQQDSVSSETKHVCWLPDYGIMKSCSSIFVLPHGMEKCPHLSKQASLHNVVNLTTDLVFGDNGYELKLKKTITDIQGVRQVALNYLEGAHKTVFTTVGSNEDIVYGDVRCVDEDKTTISLTQSLIDEDLVAVDEDMFKQLEPKRQQFKDNYFKHSPNWQHELDTAEKQADQLIFNPDRATAMDFFIRGSHASARHP